MIKCIALLSLSILFLQDKSLIGQEKGLIEQMNSNQSKAEAMDSDEIKRDLTELVQGKFFFSNLREDGFSGVINETHTIRVFYNLKGPRDYSQATEKYETISLQLFYVNGVKRKVIGMYDNDQKYGESFFNEKGERDGAQITWYKNGMMKEIVYYDQGESVGPEMLWYENGRIKSAYSSNNRVADSKTWYSDGNIYTETFEKYGSVQIMKTYYKNGNIKSIERNNDGRQKHEHFYEDGSIAMQGHVLNVDLLKVGLWESWYPNGNKMEEFYYHDTIPNMPIGTWKYYNEQGKLIKEEIYEGGELKETKEYSPINLGKKD